MSAAPDKDDPAAPDGGALQLGICLFGFIALFAIVKLIRSRKPDITSVSPLNTGALMRRNLLLGLFLANIARCFSFAAQLAFEEGMVPFVQDLEPVQFRWVRDLVELAPAIMFLSAFSVVILVWAQIHYTTTISPLPLLDCLFVCINVASYVLLVAIALCTFLFKAYSNVRPYMLCIIGFLNVVVACALFYYGLTIVLELAESSKKKLPGRWLTVRVVALSVACPIALLTRAVIYLAWDLSFGRWSLHFDLALCLGSEWFPSAIMLTVLGFLQRQSPTTSMDSFGDSTDSEAPLLHDESPAPATSHTGAPGVSWKRLYPQPSGI